MNKKIQKGGAVLGSGSFGCAIEPALLCKPIQKYHKNVISKIIPINNLKQSERKEIYDEFKIGKYLHKSDKSGLFFLNPIQACQFKLSNKDINKSLNNDLYECGIYNESPEIFNIVYPKGYNLINILNMSSPSYFFRMVTGHLAKAIQVCARKSKVLLLDIKEDNMILLQNNKKLLHPVLIDFTPEHIIGNGRKLEDFLYDFKTSFPYYIYWSPEIKTLLFRKNKIVEEKNNYSELLVNMKKYYRSNLVEMICLNTFVPNDTHTTTNYQLFSILDYYYSGTINKEQDNYLQFMLNTNLRRRVSTKQMNTELYKKLENIAIQIHNDLVESAQYVLKGMVDFNEDVAEKIMIWELGKSLYFLFEPFFILYDKKINYIKNPEIITSKDTLDYLKLLIEIHKLIFYMLHPNIKKRPSANEVMKSIDILFSYNNSKSPVKYLLSPKKLIKKENMKEFLELTKVKHDAASLKIMKKFEKVLKVDKPKPKPRPKPKPKNKKINIRGKTI